MPPSDLISVRNFRDKFAGLVRSQKDRGLLSAQSEWPEEVQQEVASRCQIADDLSFSNAAFVNPTLFHMLRQHREFNDETEREWLQKKRDLAVEQDLQRQEKLDEIQNAYAAAIENQQEQHAEELDEEGLAPVSDTPARNGQRGRQDKAVTGTTNGHKDDAPLDTNMLLSVEAPEGEGEIDSHSMEVDSGTLEDALARLASDSTGAGAGSTFDGQGVYTSLNGVDTFQNTDVGPESGVEPLSNGVLSGDSEMPALAENGKAGAGESDDGLSIDGLSDDLSSDEDDNYSPSGNKAASSAAKASARQPADVAIRTPQSALPQGITHEMLRKALANSGFVRSTEAEEDPKRVVKQRTRVVEPAGVSELESKFRTVKTSLDESTLASL
ncbi:hypothetical protein GGI08_004983, partial [Coemansia sp. S2]